MHLRCSEWFSDGLIFYEDACMAFTRACERQLRVVSGQSGGQHPLLPSKRDVRFQGNGQPDAGHLYWDARNCQRRASKRCLLGPIRRVGGCLHHRSHLGLSNGQHGRIGVDPQLVKWKPSLSAAGCRCPSMDVPQCFQTHHYTDPMLQGMPPIEPTE